MTKESITSSRKAAKKGLWIAAGLLISAVVLSLRFALPVYERKRTIDAIEHAGGWVDPQDRFTPNLGWNRFRNSSFARALREVKGVDVALGRFPTGGGPGPVAIVRDELALRRVLEWLPRLRSLQELKTLSLCDAPVQDADLDVLRDLKCLEMLDLSGTAVHGGALRHLERTTRLRSLYLTGTAVHDEGLANLPPLPELETVVLDSTQITDGGLKYLASLPKLRDLSVSNTRVTPDGLDALRRSNPRIEVSDD